VEVDTIFEEVIVGCSLDGFGSEAFFLGGARGCEWVGERRLITNYLKSVVAKA